MKTDDEIMRLFELADPARDDRVRSIDAAGYLAAIQTRSYEMKLIDTEPAAATLPHKHQWGVAAAAAAAIILIVAGVVALSHDTDQPAVPPTTTSPPTTAPAVDASAADLAVIEEGVAAFYSGNGERAAELFDLADRTDGQIRAESAYQAAIGGRVDLRCNAKEPGLFRCSTPYHNAMTEAINLGGGNDSWDVTVENGVITQFGFTEHSAMLIDMATYLISIDRFTGFEDCLVGPFDVSCATIENDNLDGWVAWGRDVTTADRLAIALAAWYRGDCEAAVTLATDVPECTPTSETEQTTAYESILQADVSVDQCTTGSGGDDPTLTCQVTYSNDMSRAVDAPATVTTRAFVMVLARFVSAGPGKAWYSTDYPEDKRLRDNFTAYAQQADFASDYAAAGCATTRSADCARLIVDHVDDWAAWYRANP